MNPNLIIIGHVALNTDVTSQGICTSIGGAAYYSAVGAALIRPDSTGIVASIGKDFNIEKIKNLEIDIDGVIIDPFLNTTQFIVTQEADGSRKFSAEWGATKSMSVKSFPLNYNQARHVHLPTSTPSEQIVWINFLKREFPNIKVSIDTFELYSTQYREETLHAISLADMVFANEYEYNVLTPLAFRDKEFILKRGNKGAVYTNKLEVFKVAAPRANVVDTTGAGDLLAGSFLAAIVSGTPKREALKTAVNLASASVEQFGVEHMLGRNSNRTSNNDKPKL